MRRVAPSGRLFQFQLWLGAIEDSADKIQTPFHTIRVKSISVSGRNAIARASLEVTWSPSLFIPLFEARAHEF